MRTVTLTAEVTTKELAKQKLRSSGKTRDDVTIFTGTCVVAEQSDFETPEAFARLNGRLIADLGQVARDTDLAKKGDDKDVVYCLNNGGLRLNYRDKILEPYRISSDRFQTAFNWAANRVGTDPTVAAAMAMFGTDPDKARAKVLELYQEANPKEANAS